ncbi:hypothetical protein TorRG33x02_308170 [Trema orientale]|uniref:Uncharacterized protein n=1 Tax=Trema orientale TaxID=63057 RepID=A0A2P5BUT6_TREOI|nr:hypothetical protein TorRG33x02_308170 [Trema orientale]
MISSTTITYLAPKQYHSSADCSNKCRIKCKCLSEIRNHGGFLAPLEATAAKLIPKIGRPKKVTRRKRSIPQVKGAKEDENDFAAFLYFF